MNTLERAVPVMSSGHGLERAYERVRATTLKICEPLEAEDYVVQSMPDVSPAKWHLAHTTWFYEAFILKPHVADYRLFDERFHYLFNSYYQTVGPMHERPARGLLSRPTVAEVRSYRAYVDEQMTALLASRNDSTLRSLVTLGLNHEQQHQELMFTDLKHVFSVNPLQPAYREAALPRSLGASPPLLFRSLAGGSAHIGHGNQSFCFDNETPRHRVWLEPFAIANRLITNAEYLEFVRDGGYDRAELWLSDGWTIAQEEDWRRPLYWSAELDAEFSLYGLIGLDPHTPVSHLSFYEADAFARWAGARLPTEAEWEAAASDAAVQGNLLDSDRLHPQRSSSQTGLQQLFGDVWEWTSSAYQPYPGYRPLPGSLGEYNGKFMCNQLVLRGGSCVTPADHIRASYRNFFYPHARWQFSGLRLARDL